MARTPYKRFNIKRIGPGKRVNGKSGEAETTIFWPHYSGKCRTVGTYSPRRNHGRVTASRQTEKTVDKRHWRVDWLWIHSAKGDVTRSSTMDGEERYQIGHLLSPTLIEEGRLVSEWTSSIALPCCLYKTVTASSKSETSAALSVRCAWSAMANTRSEQVNCDAHSLSALKKA